jgi:hypothetical protein
MAEGKRLPPPITASADRILQRPYDSAFAAIPADETYRRGLPGAGPLGGLDDGPRNWPVATVALGVLVIFATFVAGHWAPLVAGLGLVVLGALWGLVRARPIRLWKGVGTVRPDRRR